MLTKRYLYAVSRTSEFFDQIVKGTAPETFSTEHLRKIGFKSTNDRAYIPLLKDLGFLGANGAPTERYHAYRAGGAKGKVVMGQAVMEAYSDIFHVNANPTESDREAINGVFKSTHNATDKVASLQTTTFFALLKLADLNAAREDNSSELEIEPNTNFSDDSKNQKQNSKLPDDVDAKNRSVNLRYNIEIHLPATKDPEVYNAIFRSIKDHLVD